MIGTLFGVDHKMSEFDNVFFEDILIFFDRNIISVDRGLF